MMTKKELFEKLRKAENVVSVESAFDEFDKDLSAGARADLLVECSHLKYHDFGPSLNSDRDEYEDSDRYVSEITSFLSKKVHHEELYRNYI